MRNYDFNLERTKEKDMTLSQAYRTVLIAIAGFFLTAMLHTRAVAQTKTLRLEMLLLFTVPGPMDPVGPK